MKAFHVNIYKNLINSIVDIIDLNPDKEIVWCGENRWLRDILTILSDVGIDINRVIDNSSMKIGISTECYSITSFEYAEIKGNGAIYIMCSLHCREMQYQLLEAGVYKENIYLIRPIEYEIDKFNRDFAYEMFDKHKLSMQEIKDRLFSILVFFKDFCNANGLRYFLYDGTLIGAVRHKGYIPWDDDIDVAMPYEDYLKFCECFKDTEEYALLAWNRDENYEFALTRLVDKRTRIAIPEYTQHGCFMDIFLLGGYPSDQLGIEAKWAQYKKAERVWSAYYKLRDTKLGAIDTRAEIFKELFDLKFDDADTVGVMRTEKQNKWTAPKEWFSKTVELEFCGQRFTAPAGYDPYLKMKYGDYMRIPDVDKRETHGMDIWQL